MKLTAAIRVDDDDRLFAEITGHDDAGDVVAVITADDNLRRPFREQLEAWAAEHGHTITKFDMEGLR